MTGSALILKRTENLTPVPVTLPNGEVTHASHVGDLRLSSALILKNVLLVPDLKCNLISIARLTEELKCDVFFTNDICVIHDVPSRMPIGVGQRRGGVYYFRSLDKFQAHSVK
ncbi:unnamed protein product, partial [Cuscuta epithymum]